jgi:hypothetical protein
VTVAAVILAASPDSALADADGVPRIRRIADAAWAGGAMPIVVVSFDPDGAVAAALAGVPATLAEPAPPEAGPAGQMTRGIETAIALVAEVGAALIWPARMCWVGPETVTSLLEANGVDPSTVLRPAWRDEPGWPLLVPVDRLDALRRQPPDRMPPAVAEAMFSTGGRTLPLGDPGATIDGETHRADLPAYEGPAEPMTDHVHEWGAAVADLPDDDPRDADPAPGT